ncbi:MAG TPA: glycosyltransferase [Thermoanaerobaculia bacterium]|jgi:glycosyltransferase involved in cell wall biosynthesis|nr:glycosyltransferase [Thermoanaerobaculia bacterium]
MTTVVYSNVTDPRQGGGLPYVLAIAAALGEEGEVRVRFPAPLHVDLAKRLFPVPLDGLKLEHDARRSTLGRELADVLAGFAVGRVVVQATEVPRLRGLRNAHLVCEFPFQRQLGWTSRLRLSRFRSVVANSAYTAGWIERRWGRPVRVLHPPVFPIEPRGKRPWIVAVGRFAGGGRSKRQLEMVEVFRGLIERGLGGWELHLVGTGQDPESVRRVVEAARDLPVTVHLDASRQELEEVCGAASVFWHFTGALEDPEAWPERMEHFGIATVEAMSAGAVPVVVARGGQPEIVGEGAGLLWETFEQCAEQTWRLCHDEALRARLCAAARRRAEDFAYPLFAARARELFG